MKIWISVLLVGVLACKSKKETPKEEPKSGSAIAVDAAQAAAAIDAAPAAPSDERCSSPCRFLADTPLADIATKVKSTCNTEWAEASAKDCAQLDYQRNCVFATAGYTFKKQRYQDAFGKEAWYKARPDFKEADLSATATANIAELKKRAAECRKGDAISAGDKKVVDAWLAKLQAGKPEVPEIVIDDGTSRDEMAKNLAASKAQFAAKKLRGMRYVDPANLREDWKKPLEGKTVRKIVEVDFSEPDDGKCGDDECGYGLWLTLAIDDKDKVIGLEQSAAACPFVYLDGALQGEIVRNFNSPAREATQSLAVTAPCTGRVTYRLAEEKDEVTQLDELVLAIGDEVILPDVAVLRANDGRHATLARGEALEVSFDIPSGLPCGSARLRANGHYVPTRR